MTKRNLNGVGGWLAWLIFGLLVLGPLGTAGRIASDIAGAERTSPALLQLSNWGNFKEAYWATWCIAASLSIYTGYVLWKKQTPSSVSFAKSAIWLIGPATIAIQSYAIAPLILSIPLTSDYLGATAPSLLGAVISAICWTLYLQRSIRVRNTYGIPEASVISNARLAPKVKISWLWDAGPMKHEGVRRLCTFVLVIALIIAGIFLYAAASSNDWGGTSLLLSISGIALYVVARGITWVVGGFDRPNVSADR